jgi:hypothetical protein
MPQLGWFVAGVAVAVLLIPTAVGAKAALKFTGIEGTSSNQADVTSAGQLLTTEATPANLQTDSASIDPGFECDPVTAAPPTGDALVLRDLVNDFEDVPPTGTYYTYVTMLVEPVSTTNCSYSAAAFINNIQPEVNTTGIVDYPFPVGYVIPNGYQLYLEGWNNIKDQVTTNGYLIPSSDAPAKPQSAGQIPKPLHP